MKKAALIIGVLLVFGGGFMYSRSGYAANLKTFQYRDLFAEMETKYELPRGLLSRVAWQESRFRADIITGETRSPAGAVGIMQFMPGTAAELGINPLVPEQAIPAAARYLRALRREFGNWPDALAAYNWGAGNVYKWRRGEKTLPEETRDYIADISADVRGLA